MEQIRVPFPYKQLAHQLGVYFDTKTRLWYIPDDTPDELANRMRELEFLDTTLSCQSEVIDENTHTDYGENEPQICNNINTQNSDITETDWKDILEKEDTLLTAIVIRDYGMPEDENIRTQILKLLGRRHPGDYPINFDDLCICAPEFSNRYPDQAIENLVITNITNSERYEDQIRDSQTLTDEEKALLLFVLPA